MLGGYMGKVLRVDLTRRGVAEETIPEATLRAYIGGSGLGARILFDETSVTTDALAPENRLLFLTGPLTGVTIPTSGRHAVIAKSPLGQWGEADCGGTFGNELKRAGIDGIVFEGQAEEPMYLLIEDSAVSLQDARGEWSRDTFEPGPSGVHALRRGRLEPEAPLQPSAGNDPQGRHLAAPDLARATPRRRRRELSARSSGDAGRVLRLPGLDARGNSHTNEARGVGPCGRREEPGSLNREAPETPQGEKG